MIQEIQLAAWQQNPNEPGESYLADWRLRKGVEMEFDEGTTMAAGSTLVVLSFDPNQLENATRVARFREHYNMAESVPLAGGYRGNLGNGGERVELQRPDSPPSDEPGASNIASSSSLSSSNIRRSLAASRRGSPINGGTASSPTVLRNSPPASAANRSAPWRERSLTRSR